MKNSNIPTNDNPMKTPNVPPIVPIMSAKVTLASFNVTVAWFLIKLT